MLKGLTDCKENVILIAGRPGTGKTRLCLELINFYQKRGKRIISYLLETPEPSKPTEREVKISDIVNDIKRSIPPIEAVFIDYFQLIDLDYRDMKKELLLLINSAKERSVKIYMFFMLNRKFDENSPDLACFEYKNTNISEFFERVSYLKKTGYLISLKTNTTDHCQ